METLEQSEPRGFGGWLIIPVLWIAISAFYQIYSIINILSNTGIGEAFSLGSNGFQNSLAFIVSFELLLNAVLLILEGAIIFCLVKKKQNFPTIMIAWLVVLVAAAGLNPLLSNAAKVALNQSDNVAVGTAYPGNGYDFASLVRTAIHCAIWTLYFLRSRRVKLTFVN